jgi:hypothetical protein
MAPARPSRLSWRRGRWTIGIATLAIAAAGVGVAIIALTGSSLVAPQTGSWGYNIQVLSSTFKDYPVDTSPTSIAGGAGSITRECVQGRCWLVIDFQTGFGPSPVILHRSGQKWRGTIVGQSPCAPNQSEQLPSRVTQQWTIAAAGGGRRLTARVVTRDSPSGLRATRFGMRESGCEPGHGVAIVTGMFLPPRSLESGAT